MVVDVGYNEEELKLVKETRKIWGNPNVRIAATCIRVPVMRAHAESINLEFEKDISEEEALEALAKFPGVSIINDRKANRYGSGYLCVLLYCSASYCTVMYCNDNTVVEPGTQALHPDICVYSFLLYPDSCLSLAGSPPPWMPPTRTTCLSDACDVTSPATIRRDWSSLFAVTRSRRERPSTPCRLPSYSCS